jgi:hypothetical protein
MVGLMQPSSAFASGAVAAKRAPQSHVSFALSYSSSAPARSSMPLYYRLASMIVPT